MSEKVLPDTQLDESMAIFFPVETVFEIGTRRSDSISIGNFDSSISVDFGDPTTNRLLFGRFLSLPALSSRISPPPSSSPSCPVSVERSSLLPKWRFSGPKSFFKFLETFILEQEISV